MEDMLKTFNASCKITRIKLAIIKLKNIYLSRHFIAYSTYKKIQEIHLNTIKY